MSPQPVILEPPVQRWECPNCNARDVTREVNPHVRYHSCPGLKGLSAPMVPEGTKKNLRVVAHAREDYVGAECVTYDEDGTPIMAVETVHADGHTDLAVMAPMATLTGRADT